MWWQDLRSVVGLVVTLSLEYYTIARSMNLTLRQGSHNQAVAAMKSCRYLNSLPAPLKHLHYDLMSSRLCTMKLAAGGLIERVLDTCLGSSHLIPSPLISYCRDSVRPSWKSTVDCGCRWVECVRVSRLNLNLSRISSEDHGKDFSNMGAYEMQ